MHLNSIVGRETNSLLHCCYIRVYIIVHSTAMVFLIP